MTLATQLRKFATALHDAADAKRQFGATAQGISAYANNVLHNRADALAEAFPVVLQLVGEEFFGAMARAAARVQPSRSGDLNRYGETFPAFIADFPPAQSLPYLADAARLDWLCHQAYYADDAEPFDAGRLATLTPEQQSSLAFVLHPAVAVIRSPWPVASLWCAHQPTEGGDFPSPDQGGETALVWRDLRRHVQVRRILPAEAVFLESCLAGLPFIEALASALDADEEFVLEVSLQRWIADQVVTDYSTGEIS